MAALLLGVAVAAAALAMVLDANHVLRRPEQLATDAGLQIRGTEPGLVASEVVVPIDEATFFNHLHVPWPFPRRYHARVIDEPPRAGAKVIAFDVQCTEPTDARDDEALITAVARARNVVLSTTAVGRHGAPTSQSATPCSADWERAGETSVYPDSDGTTWSSACRPERLPTCWHGLLSPSELSHEEVSRLEV